MNRIGKAAGMTLLLMGLVSGAGIQDAQAESKEKVKKEGFMRRAFRDMQESARLQHQINKANFKAQTLETKAFYQEQKRLSDPKVRTQAERERMLKELDEANKRLAAAQEKVDAIKK